MRLICLKEVMHICGLDRSSIYKVIDEDDSLKVSS